MSSKVKITQKDFDEIYEISETPSVSKEQDNTEPEFLTEEEQAQDKHLEESIDWIPEEKQ